MPNRIFISNLLVALGLMAFVPLLLASDAVYEIRVYQPEQGREAAIEKVLEETAIPLLAKHDLKLCGIFRPIGNDQRIFVLIEHRDVAAAQTNWAAFENSNEWNQVIRDASQKGKLFASTESLLLKTTDYSPELVVDRIGNRIFELRTYITTEGNLNAINSRFRNFTCKLFEKHGMTNILYTNLTERSNSTRKQVLESLAPLNSAYADTELNRPARDVTLVYFLAHDSQEAAQQSFERFRADPVWIQAKSESEALAGGSLTVGNGVKSLMLKPLGCSPLQ